MSRIEVPQTAEVVVLGGGAIGASVLYELARRGVCGVLIDRGGFASESTGKSAAIVRMHYSNPPVVRMALHSRRILQHFDEIAGRSIYFQTGWAFVVSDGAAAVEETARMTQMEGVDVRRISAEEAAELFPGFRAEGLAAIYFEPESGFADPVATTRGYLDAAVSLGAQAFEGIAARRLIAHGDRVVGVETEDGVIQAGAIVLAAGPWSAKLATSIGLVLPYTVTREEELYLHVPAPGRPKAVMSSLADRMYLRPLTERTDLSHGSVLSGRGFPKPYEAVDPDDYQDRLSSGFETDLRERLNRRLPSLGDARAAGGVVGLYAATPDWHPYLGHVDGLEGLVLATGGSGHCFKLAPAIGDMVAAAIVGDSTSYADIATFALSRIAADRLLGAAIGGNRA